MSRFKKLWGQKKHALRVRLGLSQEEEDELNEVPDDAAEHFLKFGRTYTPARACFILHLLCFFISSSRTFGYQCNA